MCHCDSYVWFNPNLWSECAQFVSEILAIRDPLNAEKYRDKLCRHNIMDGGQLCERILNDINVVAVAGEHFGYGGYYLRLSCVDFVTYKDGNISTDEINAIMHMRNGAYNLATWFEEL